MNGGAYEEPPGAGTNIKGSPSPAPSLSPTQPLHIPAKRYDESVIRHSTQPWHYESPPPFDQYGQPTYYNLGDGRDSRKLLWGAPQYQESQPPFSQTCGWSYPENSHENYPIRNYPDSAPNTPYPPPGNGFYYLRFFAS